MLLRRATRYRIYPTPAQDARLRAWEHALRFVWNTALAQYLAAGQARCRVDRRYPTAFGQGVELTELRAALPWLADVPRHLCTSVLDALEKAWRRCWESRGAVGAPRFKAKKRGDRAMMAEFSGKAFRVEGEGRTGTLTFPKIGALRATIHRPLRGTQKSCALTREGDAWFASVLCEIEVPDPAPATGPALALDLGIAHLIADSDRRLVENPRAAEALQQRIARARRTVARRKRGSKNQMKARARVAALQRRARRQREHVLHVETTRIARENHSAVIVEDLNVRAMSASARGTVEDPGTHVAAKAGLNRAIADAAWSRLRVLLAYKLAERGSRLVAVLPAYSSQTCSRCQHVDAASRRDRDVFLCTACGHFDHADLNAARVLLARGLAQLAAEPAVTGCGGDVVGRPARQQGRAAKRVARA